MNKCINCGAEIKPGENFCGDCGTPVNKPPVENNTVIQNNEQSATGVEQTTTPVQAAPVTAPAPAETNNPNASVEQVTTTPVQATSSAQKSETEEDKVDEELLDAYIGKNIRDIKNKSFSWCTFFFNSIYLLYRKMWLYGFGLLFGVLILDFFLPYIGGLATVGAIILFSIKFKEWYIKDAIEKIEQIKISNPGKTKEELKELCRKKGGTTIIPVVVYIVISIVLPIIIVFIFYPEIKEEIVDGQIEANGKNKVGSLIYDVPKEYKLFSSSTDSYKSYRAELDDYTSCYLSIISHPADLYENDPRVCLDKEIYFKSTDEVNKDENYIINNNSWMKVAVESDYKTDYYYAISHGDRIYEVEYDIDNEDDPCEDLNNKVISSMEFED